MVNKIKWLLLTSSLTILLAACAMGNELEDTEKASEKIDEIEEVEEQDVQPAANIETLFETEVTFVTELTTTERRLREKLEKVLKRVQFQNEKRSIKLPLTMI